MRAALRSRPRLLPSEKPSHAKLGAYPKVFWLLVGSALLGIGLAIVWSPSFVDQTIGENGATTILGYDVMATPIGGVLMRSVSPLSLV